MTRVFEFCSVLLYVVSPTSRSLTLRVTHTYTQLVVTKSALNTDCTIEKNCIHSILSENETSLVASRHFTIIFILFFVIIILSSSFSELYLYSYVSYFLSNQSIHSRTCRNCSTTTPSNPKIVPFRNLREENLLLSPGILWSPKRRIKVSLETSFDEGDVGCKETSSVCQNNKRFHSKQEGFQIWDQIKFLKHSYLI